MTDHPDHATPPETFADLPIQPTGSGVADLEIAYEQMQLANDDEAPPADDRVGDDEAETVAHPS